MSEPLLVAKGLFTHFELRQWGFIRLGVVRAVDGVDFSLAAGDSAAVVGESGCGKSSLSRTLLGLYRPTGGQVLFAGRSLAGLKGAALKEYRAQVGYVQQDPFGALPPFMTVRRALEEPLLIHNIGRGDRGERLRRIDAALDEVGLEPAAVRDAFPHQLSGGQQQRVVIARALLLRPRLIIADEPVSMLDASVRVEILELLHRVRREHNIALLYITHDLSTVRHYAAKVLVMYAGRLVEQAPVESLLARPGHPYTEALLAALADPDAANARQQRQIPEGEPPSLLNPPPGCRFHPRCPHKIPGTCDVHPPPNFEPTPGHLAACWLQQPKTQ